MTPDISGTAAETDPPVLSAVPSDLLTAVSAPAGGRLVIVTGAGSSIESPTCLASGADYAEAAHQRLLDDHVLEAGDCATPRDLSLLADAVYAKTGSQLDLARRLPRDRWRMATPNDGHLAAAALLIEGAVRALVTLNYDLALQTALGQLGAPTVVTVCKGPEDFANASGRTLFYLHRSAESPEEQWVLRKDDLDSAWQGAWEELVASGTLTAPMTLFAGLGSPAAVLNETVARLAAIGHTDYYYADPYPENDFLSTMRDSLSAVLKLSWCDVMLQLSNRVASAQRHELLVEARRRCTQVGGAVGFAAAGVAVLDDLDLVTLGGVRAAWLLHPGNYRADQEGAERLLLADLVVAIGAIASACDSTPKLSTNKSVLLRTECGALEFHCAHGAGVHSWATIQELIRQRFRPSPGSVERSVLVGGVAELGEVLAGDLVRAEDDADLIRGPETFVRINLAEARVLAVTDPDELRRRLAL